MSEERKVEDTMTTTTTAPATAAAAAVAAAVPDSVTAHSMLTTPDDRSHQHHESGSLPSTHCMNEEASSTDESLSTRIQTIVDQLNQFSTSYFSRILTTLPTRITTTSNLANRLATIDTNDQVESQLVRLSTSVRELTDDERMRLYGYYLTQPESDNDLLHVLMRLLCGWKSMAKTTIMNCMYLLRVCYLHSFMYESPSRHVRGIPVEQIMKLVFLVLSDHRTDESFICDCLKLFTPAPHPDDPKFKFFPDMILTLSYLMRFQPWLSNHKFVLLLDLVVPDRVEGEKLQLLRHILEPYLVSSTPHELSSANVTSTLAGELRLCSVYRLLMRGLLTESQTMASLLPSHEQILPDLIHHLSAPSLQSNSYWIIFHLFCRYLTEPTVSTYAIEHGMIQMTHFRYVLNRFKDQPSELSYALDWLLSSVGSDEGTDVCESHWSELLPFCVEMLTFVHSDPNLSAMMIKKINILLMIVGEPVKSWLRDHDFIPTHLLPFMIDALSIIPTDSDEADVRLAAFHILLTLFKDEVHDDHVLHVWLQELFASKQAVHMLNLMEDILTDEESPFNARLEISEWLLKHVYGHSPKRSLHQLLQHEYQPNHLASPAFTPIQPHLVIPIPDWFPRLLRRLVDGRRVEFEQLGDRMHQLRVRNQELLHRIDLVGEIDIDGVVMELTQTNAESRSNRIQMEVVRTQLEQLTRTTQRANQVVAQLKENI